MSDMNARLSSVPGTVSLACHPSPVYAQIFLRDLPRLTQVVRSEPAYDINDIDDESLTFDRLGRFCRIDTGCKPPFFRSPTGRPWFLTGQAIFQENSQCPLDLPG